MIYCLLWRYPVIWASTNCNALTVVLYFSMLLFLYCSVPVVVSSFVMCCSGTCTNCSLWQRRTYSCSICRLSTGSWLNTWNDRQGEGIIVQLFQIPKILFSQYCVVCLYHVDVCVICNILATVSSVTFPPLSDMPAVCLSLWVMPVSVTLVHLSSPSASASGNVMYTCKSTYF